MGIAQALPTAYKNTYDFLVNNEGYGLPVTRRLPYADYGLVLAQALTGSPTPQTIQTASYGASHLGLETGKFIHINPGGANEEYMQLISVDPDNQTFDAIMTKDHAAGERMRPTIWPTPVLHEGDDLAFDILGVASPDPGSDLTVVIQTSQRQVPHMAFRDPCSSTDRPHGQVASLDESASVRWKSVCRVHGAIKLNVLRQLLM